MLPSAFDEDNAILDAPPGLVDLCQSLSVYIGGTRDGMPVVISCWKPSVEELEEIKRTGRIWLTIMGHMMPPVHLSSEKPFEE